MTSTSNPAHGVIPLCSIFRRFLKSKHLRYTKERADVLDAIMTLEDNVFDIDAVINILKTKEIGASKATVYRTISLIQEAGIIDRAFVNGRQTHYQLIDGNGQLDQMLCVVTGKTINFEHHMAKDIAIKLCNDKGWDFVGYKFQVYGASSETDSSL